MAAQGPNSVFLLSFGGHFENPQQLFSSLFISMDAVVYLVVPYYVPHVAACAVDT